MAYDYDTLYAQTPHALGAPTQVFVDFFATYAKSRARVLDIGCGQGRDALFIARLGHQVVGVDLSAHGVNDMMTAAASESLQIEGIVADIADFTPNGVFDVIVIDRTLHMLEQRSRMAALERFLTHVTPDGWILIADEKSNIADFKTVFDADKASWDFATERNGTLFVQWNASN